MMMANNAEQSRVLLVEDGDGDAFLVEELLQEADTGLLDVNLPRAAALTLFPGWE